MFSRRKICNTFAAISKWATIFFFLKKENIIIPYRIINWSEGTDTTSVTSGVGGKVWQQAAKSPYLPPPDIKIVLDMIDEIKKKKIGIVIQLISAATLMIHITSFGVNASYVKFYHNFQLLIFCGILLSVFFCV